MKKPSTRYNHRLRILHSPTQISRMRSVVYIPVCHSSFPPKLFPTVHAPPPSHHPSSPHQLQYAVQLKYPFVATHLSVTCTVIGSALHLRSFGKSRTIPSRISIPLKHTQRPTQMHHRRIHVPKHPFFAHHSFNPSPGSSWHAPGPGITGTALDQSFCPEVHRASLKVPMMAVVESRCARDWGGVARDEAVRARKRR
jgi:hypothetical protein